MKPLIDIRSAPTGFTYRISTRGLDGIDGGAAFDTLERCLSDAAASLGDYFPRVQLRFEGDALGSCATAALRYEPHTIVALIAQQAMPA
ncbi:hypothetical protein [Variovorax sp. ZT4R33]|uniref:hypothetical protein n=1 Tax=Variovorax sp. ZT4R33 TaxID=3443743 RepID=UPI003F46136D